MVSTPSRSSLRAPIRLSFGDRASRGTFSPAPEGPTLAAGADPSMEQSMLLLHKSVRMNTAPAVAAASTADLRVLSTDRAASFCPFQSQLPFDLPLKRSDCNNAAEEYDCAPSSVLPFSSVQCPRRTRASPFEGGLLSSPFSPSSQPPSDLPLKRSDCNSAAEEYDCAPSPLLPSVMSF